MKVLITSTGPGGTGSAFVVEGLVNSLLKLGHQPKVVFPTAGLSSWGFERNKRCFYQPLLFPRWINRQFFYTFPLIIPDPHPFNFNNAWTYKDLTNHQFATLTKFFKRSLAAICEHFQPHIVECQHIWLFAELVRQLGLPYICVAHHSDQMGFLMDKRMQKLACRAAKGAKKIFAVSEFVKNEVLSLYQLPSSQVEVIPNGYNQQIFQPQKVNKEQLFSHFKLPQSNLPLITFAGRISRTKGIDVLLKANKIIQHKQPAILIIMGGGKLKDALLAKSEKYNFTNCFFLGHQPPQIVAQFHNLAVLSVVPSRTEGFGLTALEAMGCGTPVVATNVGALPQFVVGQIVKTEDVDGLAEAILNYLSLSEEQKKFYRRQALKAALKYSWLEMTKKRLPFYYAFARFPCEVS